MPKRGSVLLEPIGVDAVRSPEVPAPGSMTDQDRRDYHVPTIVASLIMGVYFGGVGGGVAFPTLPTLGAVLGITPFVVGLILSANRFTRLLMSTPAGQIIDKLGARRPMILGFLLQGIAPFGYILGLYPHLVPYVGAAEIFIASRVVWGFGSAFVFVGAFSTVIHVTTQANRGKWIGYFRGGQSLGFPSGLIAGGILTDIFGFEVAFATAGASGLLAAVVAAAVLPDVRATIQTPARLREVPRIVSQDVRILMIGSVNFSVRFLYGGVLLSTVVLYAQVHGIGLGGFDAIGTAGLIMGISVLAAGGTTVIAGALSDRVPNRALVTIPGLAFLVAGFGILALYPTQTATLLGVALIGVGVGGTNPPLLAYLGDISPDADVGKMGGIYNVFGDMGATLGPIIALPLAALIGFRAEYLLCAALGIVVSFLVLYTLVGASPDPQPHAIQPGD